MSDFVAIENIKDALAQCPICTEYFSDTSRIPRRMPCCLQAICEPCLEIYSQGSRTISCPLCRQHHNLLGGVKSLPKETQILRFLDVLKTQSNAVPSCTDCPDNNTAMARCDSCSIYMCQPCLAAHSRNRISRDHKTTTFEEIKSLHSTRSSKPVTQQKSEYPYQVNQKLKSTMERIQILTAIGNNLGLSKKTTTEQINSYFDDLMAELQQRRGILLSEADSKADKEHKSIMRSIESHKTYQNELQKAANGEMSESDLLLLLAYSPEDIKYNRRGVSFMEDNKKQLTSIIKTTGIIRTITFLPSARQEHAFHSSCDIISLENAQIPKAEGTSLKLSSAGGQQEKTCFVSDHVLLTQGSPIFCTDIEFDPSFSSDEIAISGSGRVIQNRQPEPLPTPSGCRLKSRRGFFSKPFLFDGNQRYLYQVKVRFKMKRRLDPVFMIWEVASNIKHLDLNGSQTAGFTVDIRSCGMHETHANHMCLSVRHNSSMVFCQPIVHNKAGETGDLHIGILLDAGRRQIHVIDVDGVSLLTSVSVVFDEAVWTSMSIGREENCKLKVELLSGKNVSLSESMVKLLETL